MAKGSEQFTWKRWWPHERVCSFCGATLRVQDVGEVRRHYSGEILEEFIWCNNHRGGHA